MSASENRREQAAATAAWPRERAFEGTCDFHVGEPTPTAVVVWADEYDCYAACEPCYSAMAEAWDALTPEEQEASLAVE